MGGIYRNRIKYAGTKTARLQMTQAEYDALPTATKNDGQFRVITDAPSIFDLIYPVGSIFMSVNNMNPQTWMRGTTWETWGSGRVPVGVSNDTEFNTVEKTGGEKTHTLDVSEMPNHNHTHKEWIFNGAASSGAHYGFGYQSNTGVLYSKPSATTSGEIQFGNEATGGGGAHNNLQPYITCYMWKRTS